ncbi:MAG: hypothetical protein L0228_00645 [Planctomycetes bacterium]|nr:hypothetical protein [Planctomycetota bacterium]
MKDAGKAWSVVSILVLVMFAGSFSAGWNKGCAQTPAVGGDQLVALMVEPTAPTKENLAAWKNEGFDAIVLILDERFEAGVYKESAKLIAASSIALYYWIEVGRNEAFASDHPEWMASIGSHDDWRNSFRNFPRAREGEVVKAWPWTPIGYKEAFDAHVTRITELLERVPSDYRGLLLNDLQGGPSSCGCGNIQCRWALDYGVRATTKKLTGNDVAARFVAEVRKLCGPKEIIPVWTTECDREDMAIEKQAQGNWTTGFCGHVDCFDYCLDRFSEQWSALHATHRGPTGVLLLHKELRRDRKEYGGASDWVTHGVRYLKQEKLKALPPEKLWLVIQGYDVSRPEEAAALQAAARTGAGGVVVARTRIDQSYEPRLVRVKEGKAGRKASRIP